VARTRPHAAGTTTCARSGRPRRRNQDRHLRLGDAEDRRPPRTSRTRGQTWATRPGRGPTGPSSSRSRTGRASCPSPRSGKTGPIATATTTSSVASPTRGSRSTDPRRRTTARRPTATAGSSTWTRSARRRTDPAGDARTRSSHATRPASPATASIPSTPLRAATDTRRDRPRSAGPEPVTPRRGTASSVRRGRRRRAAGWLFPCRTPRHGRRPGS